MHVYFGIIQLMSEFQNSALCSSQFPLSLHLDIRNCWKFAIPDDKSMFGVGWDLYFLNIIIMKSPERNTSDYIEVVSLICFNYFHSVWLGRFLGADVWQRDVSNFLVILLLDDSCYYISFTRSPSCKVQIWIQICKRSTALAVNRLTVIQINFDGMFSGAKLLYALVCPLLTHILTA